MHDESLLPFAFPAVQGKKITAAFGGGRPWSDGGVLLLREAERRLDMAGRLAALVPDRRDGAGVIPGAHKPVTSRGLWALGPYVPPMREFLILSVFASCVALAGSGPGMTQTPGAPAAATEQAALAAVVSQARALRPLETFIVSRDGDLLVEEGFRGNSTSAPTNIKSASKSIISALVGIAIDKGVLDGPDQKIAPLLRDRLPERPDPQVEEITVGNLLSMQAGLEPTSGGNYGRWAASADWVRVALAQPFAYDPGQDMQYSTGSTHLLSAILTRESGKSTLELAREWLEPLEGFDIAG